MATSNTEKHENLELLPWYLNGTLGDEEAERIRNQIESSAELQAEADETDALFKALGDDVPVPMLTHERIEGVMARLDEKPQPTNPISSLIDRLRQPRRLSRFGPASYIPVALAAAAVLVAVVVIAPQPVSEEPVYSTLYEDRPSIPVLVEIADDVSNTDAQLLFEALSLEAELQPGGAYRIDLPNETSVAELYEILRVLRADGRVADAQALTEKD
ncbi:MAG: hypothetical protein ACR2QZ_03620 [Woeseiaceae bacterium]